MTVTPSSMLKLGTTAPEFSLPDTISNKTLNLQQLKSEKATLIMFICNHCPFVKHVQQELIHLANDYIPKGISFIAISANDAKNFPDDAPDKMKETAKKLGYPFPYLYDETQSVAKAYQAACTPDFFIFNKELKLVYRGQLDDSRPGNNNPINGKDIRAAFEAILNNSPINPDQKPSIGCNIKWRD